MSDFTPDDRSQVLPEVWSGKEQLQRAHDFLMDKLSNVCTDHGTRSEKWRSWDAAYRLVDPQRPEQGSAVVDPEIQIEVDTLVANEVEAFLGQDPSFQFKGTEETDEAQAELMTDYVADSLRRIQLREKFERTIRQKKIYGTCFVKTPYVRDIKKRKVRQVVERTTDARGREKLKTEVSTIDFPLMDDTDWEYVSIFDIYPVGRGSDLQTTEGVIQVFEKTYDQLLEREFKKDENGVERGIYHNLSSVAPLIDRKLKVAEYWGKIPRSVITGNIEDRFDKFEGVITAVIDLPENDNEKREQRSIHSERTGEMVHSPDEPDSSNSAPTGGIRLQENPFWDNSRPYLSCPDTPVDNELYGVGVVEILVEKWHELNSTIRGVSDQKTLQLLNPTIEDVNAGVQRGLKLTQNPRIKCNDINGVKPFPIANTAPAGYAYIAQVKDDMRRASGATEGIQGVPVRGEQSATEFATIQQQAGIRLKSKIKLVDERLFKPFLERTYKNAMQFATTEKFVRVHGVKGTRFQPVPPEDIWGTFDIITKGATEFENNIIMANKLIQFMQIASNIPQVANIPFLLQEVWTKLGMPEQDKHKVILAGTQETESDIIAEIEAMSLGQPVTAKQTQNHATHIQMKTEAFRRLRQSGLETSENQEAFRNNIDAHSEMLVSEQAQQGGIPPQASLPNVDQLETPNPVEEQLGPSPQGTGLSGI